MKRSINRPLHAQLFVYLPYKPLALWDGVMVNEGYSGQSQLALSHLAFQNLQNYRDRHGTVFKSGYIISIALPHLYIKTA